MLLACMECGELGRKAPGLEVLNLNGIKPADENRTADHGMGCDICWGPIEIGETYVPLLSTRNTSGLTSGEID